MAAVALAACAVPAEEPPAPLEVVEEGPRGVDKRQLDDAVREIEAATDTRIGLALYDGAELTAAGTVASLPAWSTIKVPIAFSATEYCDYAPEYLEDLIAASIEISDNDATNALWACLEASGGAQTLVREQVGLRIDAAWGRTPWPFASQARYAYKLSRRDDVDTNPILGHMGQIAEEQAWGLGALDIPFKGGWGDVEANGSWQSRQMGFGELGGVTYGIAFGAVSDSGSFGDTIEALDAVTELLVQASGSPME